MNSLIDFDEKTANILAVDDDWENLLLLSDILKANGYKVRLAETAEQAFEQIEASKPDVILLDIAMPTTSGYEICKKIKQNAETRDIPVIFVTIHGNVEDKKRAYEVGGVDFITKPFHPDEVLARVENQLHGAFLLHTIQRASEKFLHEMKMNAEILVVDDVPDNLQLLLDLLKSKGYKIRPANTGELALASISARKPDLILLDLKLPGLNGFEVCKKLKADPETRDIPVIFLTARNDVIDKVAAFEAGGADFVTKPFQPEEVLAR
jgi:DNA-binding response OmpR family regulator